MDNHRYTISFFNDNRDIFPKQENLTFEELKSRLTKTARNKCISKDNLEGMICGEFRQNKRAAEYLRYRSIITYDIDNYNYNLEKLTSACESQLKDIKYLYYTTISSTYSNPRIRILIFPNRNIVTSDYSNLSQRLAKELFSSDIFEAIDKSSYSAMQLMYLPSLATKSFKSNSNDGDVVDITKYLDANITKYKDNFVIDYKNVPLTDIDDAKVWEILDQYDVEETDRHDWFKVCQALHHQYSGNEKGLEIFKRWSLRDSRYTEKHIENATSNSYKSIKSECENPITFASVIKTVKDKKKLPITVSENVWDFNIIERKKFEKENGDIKYNKKEEPIGLKSTYKNFKIMCKLYKIELSHDIISKQIVNSLNIKSSNALASIIKSAMELNDMDRGLANDYIHFMGETNSINTFKNALNNDTWDKQDRLRAFFNTVEVEDEYKEVRDLYLLKWLQQMLYLTLHDLEKDGLRKIGRNLLVLQSNQSGGKSTWVKSLLPPELSDYIGEGLHLDTNDDMSVLACIRNIFVELGELEQSFKATDINQFKAFFGRTKDVLNLKYVSYPVTYTRTTSFLGTINEVSFLKDKTGSTRFLVLPVKRLDGFHGIDMLQLYRQIIETKGYIDFELNEKEREKQRIINEEFQQPDLMEEQFIDVYETKFKEEDEDELNDVKYRNCTEILEQLGYVKRDINHMRRCDIANVLRKYKFKYRKLGKKWLVKLKKGK